MQERQYLTWKKVSQKSTGNQATMYKKGAKSQAKVCNNDSDQIAMKNDMKTSNAICSNV